LKENNNAVQWARTCLFRISSPKSFFVLLPPENEEQAKKKVQVQVTHRSRL
jgi:hypothetical protein